MTQPLTGDRQMELMTQLGDIALELGWVIAIPPTDTTEGIIMGTLNYVASIDELLPEEEKLDILINDEQMGEIQDELDSVQSSVNLDDKLISTNVIPKSTIPKKGGYNVH
jgi:hypothetical protein